MKIGIYNAALPIYPTFTVGGVQNFFEDLSVDLGQKGHKIAIINFQDMHQDRLAGFDLGSNVEIHYYPRTTAQRTEKRINVYRRTEAKYEIENILEECDLVIYDTLKDLDIQGVKQILHWDTIGSSSWNAASFHADVALYPSEYTMNINLEYININRFKDTKHHVIPYGINLDIFTPNESFKKFVCDKFNIDEDTYLISSPVRLWHMKGLEDLISSFRSFLNANIVKKAKLLVPIPNEFMQKNLNQRMSVDGFDLDLLNRLKNKVKALNLENDVIFHDWINRSEFPKYLGGMDLCVFLSNHFESFGIAPIQSIACGTPVILSKVANYRYLMPKDEGAMLINPFDTESLLKRIQKLQSVDFYSQVLLNGQNFIKEQYNLLNVTNSYLSLFEALMAGTFEGREIKKFQYNVPNVSIGVYLAYKKQLQLYRDFRGYYKLSNEDYGVYKLCDGKRTIGDIARELKKDESDISKIISKLRDEEILV